MAGKTPYKVGDVFNKRKIVEYCGSDPKFKVSLWKYECLLCGTINGPVRTATITRKDRLNSVPKCCLKYESGTKSFGWKGYEELPMSYFTQVKVGAEKRGIPFEVSIEEMWMQWTAQNGKCFYTKRPLVFRLDASLDRIDSSIGYTKSNIQWVHKDVNKMKNVFTNSEFLTLCKEVAENYLEV